MSDLASSSRLSGCSVCLGVSGSVAAVKAPDLADALLQRGVSVDLVVTAAAFSLLQATYRDTVPWARLTALAAAHPPHVASAVEPGATDPAATDTAATDTATGAAPPPSLRIWRDADEWANYTSVGGDPVLHVDLAKRNSLLLIAPLCANSLAGAALGLCGNLLGSVLRAWYYDLDPEFADPLAARYGEQAVCRPVLVAPAMNTFMWHQRITSTHLASLRERGVHVVPPISKKLACGDEGVGAMAEVSDVIEVAVRLLQGHVDAEAAARAAGKPPFTP